MRQFKEILKFELASYYKNKVFIAVTIILVCVVAGLLFFPRIQEALPEVGEEEKESSKILIVSNLSIEEDYIESTFRNLLQGDDIEVSDKSEKEIREMVKSKKIDGGIFISSPTKFLYIVRNGGMFDFREETLKEGLEILNQQKLLAERGLSSQEIKEILGQEIKGETVILEEDQGENFFYAYILIFVLYMTTIIYGQMVASSVASEKSNRSMELLITTADPRSFMFGKVIASGLAGLIRFTAVLMCTYGFYQINKEYWIDNNVMVSIFGMPMSIILYTLLFYILGYTLYAFIYGMIGSLVSKIEEVGAAITPLPLLMCVSFMVVIISLSSGNLDSKMLIIASYIPLYRFLLRWLCLQELLWEQ